MTRAALALIALVLAGCAPSAPAQQRNSSGQAQRIVSINPCVDAILAEVADPAQIAAISRYSADPRSASVEARWALRFPAIGDSAEEVIAARPDLVIAGPHVGQPTLAALKRLGIPLLQLGVPTTVAESRGQITMLSARIGRQQQGAALLARIDAALAQSQRSGPPVRGLIWQGGGLVPGKGTLADALMVNAGIANGASEMGLDQWDVLPMEQLLANPPALLLTSEAGKRSDPANGAAVSGRVLAHPALAGLRRSVVVEPFPARLLHCGGPTIIAASQRLAEARDSVVSAP